MGGGGEKVVYQPAAAPAAAPTATESTAEAVKAQVEALPQVYQAQLEYGPKFAEEQYQQYAQYAPLYSQTSKEIQESLYPESTALQEPLAKQAATGMEEGVPDWMREEYLSGVRSQLGEQGASRLGGDYISRGLMAQSQSLQDYYRNLALSVTGRVPITTTSYPGASSSGVTVPSSAGLLNYGASTYGSYTSAAAQTAIANAQGQLSAQTANLQYGGSPWGQIAGAAGGALLGSFTGGLGTTLGNSLGSTVATAMSSIVLKKNVKNIDNALEIIEQLDGVVYDWKENNQSDGGVIAEELESVLPEAVTELNGYKAIKPMMLIGYLIEAVKELSSQLKEVRNG